MSALNQILERPLSRISPRRVGVFALAGLVIGAWWLYTPAGLLGKADAVAYSVCHRIDVRSFHLGARAIPLCARCTGMYLGALFGLVYFGLIGRGRAGAFPSLPVVGVLAGFVAFFGVDGLNSYLHFFPSAPHLYEPNNTLRLITGTGLGLSLATFLYAGFNQNAWKIWRRRAPVASLVELIPLMLVGALIVLAVLTENDLILYPLALVSSAGVLVLLAGVYTTLVLLVLRRENEAEGWRDLILPLSLGLTLAILQIGLIDLARFLATGTWSGFTL